MMVRRILVAVGMMAALVAVTACGSSGNDASGSGSGTKSAKADGNKITVIMPSLANDAYLLEKAGAEAEAKRNPGQQVSVVTGAGQQDRGRDHARDERHRDQRRRSQAGHPGSEARRAAGREGRRVRRADPGAHR